MKRQLGLLPALTAKAGCLATGAILVVAALGAEARAGSIQVAQESSAGAGDFDANVLGTIDPFDTAMTASGFYQYDNPNGASYNGDANGGPLPVPDLSQIFLVNASDGLSLFVVHDAPGDADGGTSQTQWNLTGDTAAAVLADDPGEAVVVSAGGAQFNSTKNWVACCTDGYVIGSLDGNWALFGQFVGAPTGITNWEVTSDDLTTVALVLEPGRRVRLSSVPPIEKEITSGPDVNGDGEIDLAVEAPQSSSLHYDFEITVNTSGLSDPAVYDSVPAEWDVSGIDGAEPGNSANEDKKGDQAPGLACGESDDLGDIDVWRGGKFGKQCQSATHMLWDLDPDITDMVHVDLQSRLKNKSKSFYSPTGCGALYLNEGAVLMDGISVVAETPPLCVAAVHDLDGGGIDPTGAGDEDGDGYSDWLEACSFQTDPCTFQNDVIIDADGISTPGRGILNANPDQQVVSGNSLTNWPTGGLADEGIDGFDNDASGDWTFGDDIHLEDPDGACSTAIRDGAHDLGSDCKVLDLDGSLADGQPVSCDFESGSFCPPNFLSGGATGDLTFFDSIADGVYNNGEDIVLDGNANGVFD